MKMIPNSITKNDYYQNCDDTIFTVLLRHAMIEQGEALNELKPFTFVHGLLQYPKWRPDSDIFQFIKPEYLERMQRQESFFVFDASTEGFSPIHEFPFFEMLYFNCKKYNVDPSMVIYVSSNLKDEQTMKKFAEDTNRTPINVYSFLSFEQVLAIDDRKIAASTDEQYHQAVKNCNASFTDKLFSSLSRVLRKYRTIATFILCHSEIAKYGLISHDKIRIEKTNVEQWLEINKLSEYTHKQFWRWQKSLPLIADRDDFEINWAFRPYSHLHDSTIFQIVNETLVMDHLDTSLFYSEKTFRPIAYFQPFVIYGQIGCNHALKDLGYKLYDEWFDLSFDFEPDPVLRYKKLLQSVTDAVHKLEAMTREEKIAWRFKNEDILLHNFTTMVKSQYSKDKLVNFLKGLNESRK